MFCMFGVPVYCPNVIGSYVGRISEAPSGNRVSFIAGWRRGRLIRPTSPASRLATFAQNLFFISAHAVQPLAARWRVVTLAIHLPDGLPRQRFCSSSRAGVRCSRRWLRAGAVARSVLTARAAGLFHIAGTDHPRGDAVNGGVEEVEADVYAVKQVVAHDPLAIACVSSSSSTT